MPCPDTPKFNRQNENRALCSKRAVILPLTKRELVLLRREAKSAFARDLPKRINLDEFLDKQTDSGLPLGSDDVKKLAAGYSKSLRHSAEQFAVVLEQAVRSRRGFVGIQERQLIESQIDHYIAKMTSKKTSASFFTYLAEFYTLTNRGEAERVFADMLAGTAVTGLLTTRSTAALDRARLLHGTGSYRESAKVPASLKVTDPERHPLLTVAEVREFLGKGRSTIYRWLEEGKLKRPSLGKEAGKRSTCLILTDSVKKLLEEASE